MTFVKNILEPLLPIQKSIKHYLDIIMTEYYFFSFWKYFGLRFVDAVMKLRLY